MREVASWNGAVAAWLEWLRAGGARPATVELRKLQGQRLAAEVGRRDPWSVTPEDLAGWIAGHVWSLETLRSHRAACRSFYGWGHAAGHIGTDPARLLRPAPAGPARPRPAPDAAVFGALAAADERVGLMIALGCHGLRRGEIARARTDALSADLDGWTLLVDGKGGKVRPVPLADATARAIRKRAPGWVFPNGFGSHLTPAHVGKLISRMLPDGVTPHQLRHRCATEAYRETRDLEAVRLLLGHASLTTTQRYVAVDQSAVRAAVLAAVASVA